jgi:hypothetical protein
MTRIEKKDRVLENPRQEKFAQELAAGLAPQKRIRAPVTNPIMEIVFG